MKSYKIFICFLLIFAVSLGLLYGCGKKTDKTGEPADENVSSTDGYIREDGYLTGIKALDYVEMFNYKAINIPNDVHNISDDALQNEISNLMADYSSETQITDRAVISGDKVNIDYVGSVDGVEFDGGSTGGEGTNVIAGSTDYIDDFLTQIIGHMPGETINVEVTFPEDYNAENLKGKDALFVTTINYIVLTEEPELTDAFVLENFTESYGWKTVDEMKSSMKSDMQKNAVQQYIRKYFTTEINIKSVPDEMIKYQEESMIKYYQEYADMYGMELNEFLSSMVGFESVETLIDYYQYNNLEESMYLLVIQAIAEDMNFLVSDDDLAAYFMKYVGSSDYSQYVEQYGIAYVKHVVMRDLILDYIVENAILG